MQHYEGKNIYFGLDWMTVLYARFENCTFCKRHEGVACSEKNIKHCLSYAEYALRLKKKNGYHGGIHERSEFSLTDLKT